MGGDLTWPDTLDTELLVSAAGGSAPELREQTLSTRVLMYARQHLTEPGLTPQRIADAQNVSVRQLYKVCADAGVRLEQWLIEQRLEAARAELAAPAGGGAPSRPRPAPAASPIPVTSAGGFAPPTG